MKKVISNLLLCLLAAFAAGAQTSITVEGTVIATGSGNPVPNWYLLVSVPGNPADSMSVLAYTITDNNGHYSTNITLPAGLGAVQVQTYQACQDPGVFELVQVVPVVNGSATADFEICYDVPPFPDCWADGWYSQNMPGTLDVQFYGNGYGLDSAITFSYHWDFGDGNTSTEQNPVHTYAAGGEYTAVLTVSSPTCTTTTQMVVWLYEPYNGPTDTIVVSGYIYNSTDSTPVVGWWVTVQGADPWWPSYGWTDSTGFYSLGVAVPAGDSLVQIETADCTGFPQIQTVFIVNGYASADFYICADFPPPVPGCAAIIYYEQIDSLTYQFSADVWSTSDSTNAPLTYFWDFGDGSTSTEANPTHVYAADGIYSVSFTSTDANGCVAYACDVVCTLGGGVIDTFWYGCQAMFWANANPAPGLSQTYQFFDASFGAAASWFWSFGDGSTDTTQNPVHTYDVPGLYMVTLHITTIDGCESSIALEIWVGNNPWNEWGCQAMFLPLPDGGNSGTGFYFADLSLSPGPIVSWSWDFGDGNTSAEQNPFHEYAQPGIYTVSLTIESPFDSCSSTFSMELNTENPLHFDATNAPTLGIAGGSTSTVERPVFEKLTLFPNPASSDVTLAFESREARDFELRIADMSGKTVLRSQQKAIAGTNVARLGVADLAPGLYLAQMVGERGVQTLKFVKE